MRQPYCPSNHQIHQMKHRLDNFSKLPSDQFLFLCSVTEINHQSEQNTNHNLRVLFVVCQFCCSSEFFLLLVDLFPPPLPGLLWAVFPSCLTTEMCWVWESEPVLRTSPLPALTLSSSWRNMAMERWALTVSDAIKRYTMVPKRVAWDSSGSQYE